MDGNGWEEQESKDPQHYPGHNKELFWIWNEKTNMMKMVSDINPFSSSYFVWMDIGAVRHTEKQLSVDDQEHSTGEWGPSA